MKLNLKTVLNHCLKGRSYFTSKSR